MNNSQTKTANRIEKTQQAHENVRKKSKVVKQEKVEIRILFSISLY